MIQKIDHSDPDTIRARCEAAWTQKRELYGYLEEAYRHAMPGLNPYAEAGIDDSYDEEDVGSSLSLGGYYESDYLFDSTLAWLAQRLTNRIVAGVFPIGTHWGTFHLGPHGSAFGSLPKARQTQLEKDQDVVFNTISASNFHPAINESMLEIVVAGLGAIRPERTRSGDNRHVQFEFCSQAEIAPEAGEGNDIWAVFRKVRLTKEMIKWKWPEADVSHLRDDRVESKTGPAVAKRIALIEAARFNPEKGNWMYDIVVGKGDSVRSGMKSKQVIYSTTMRRNPWVIGRWAQAGRNAHGRSPVMTCLADSRSLNATMEITLKNASMACSGIYVYNDASTFNPDTAEFMPGSFLPVRQTGGPNADIAPLNVGGDLQLSQVKMEEMRTSLRRMMLDEGLPSDDRTRRTATEVLWWEKQLERDLGTPYNRIVKEFGIPILQRVVDILTEKGAISAMWSTQDIQGNPALAAKKGKPMELDGQEVVVEFTGPLATSQRLVDLHNLVQTLEIGHQYLGTEVMNMSLKMEDILAKIAEYKNVSKDLVRDTEERQKLADSAAEAGAQMMQMRQQGVAGVPGG